MNTLVLFADNNFGKYIHRKNVALPNTKNARFNDESVQKFLLQYVDGLCNQIEEILKKIHRYPELVHRWSDSITTIEGNLGALLYSFENLIHDSSFDWGLGRKEFDKIIVDIKKIENFVDKYIALKASKKVEKIINDTVPIIKEQEDLLSLPHEKKEESIKEVSLEKKMRRREKIMNFIFKETPGTLLIDPEIINNRITRLEELYEIFGVGSKELENIILEDKDKYDKKWLNDNLKILIQEPTNTKLRQDVECALYYLRKGGTLPDFTGIHNRTDQKIDIFTLGGTMTLLPPFRQYKGLLYGRIVSNGQLEICKFDTQTILLNKASKIEILDKKSSTWKAKSFIPLIIDKVFIETLSKPIKPIKSTSQPIIEVLVPTKLKTQESTSSEWQDTQPNSQVEIPNEHNLTSSASITQKSIIQSKKEEKRKSSWISNITTRAKSLWTGISKVILG